MIESDSIRLLLVDDHDVVRTGLRMLLQDQPDIEIVGEASTGEEAYNLAQEMKPDVIVMDITLPDESGISVTKRIKENLPEIAVIALTIHDDEQYFFKMLEAGASGYVPKKAAPEDLIYAIRTAFGGEIYLYPTLATSLVSDAVGRRKMGEEMDTFNGLTARETEVLEKLAEGMSNEEIALEFSISKHTVARHRENIMRKLNLHSRSELVKYAIRKGLILP
ncbi:MAG: response regulator [Anaerolineales bacterium]